MSPRFRFGIAAVILILSVVFFVRSCTDDDARALPEGPQSVTGILKSVPLSLNRRGTHVLQVRGEEQAYVESTSVNLRDYENLEVVIDGLYELNLDPEALPVLVASGVTLTAVQSRSWSVDLLHLSLDVPSDWEGEEFENGMRFMRAETINPVLRVYKAASDTMPQGERLQVGGRTAARTEEEGSSVVYVRDGEQMVAFSHSPAPDEDAEKSNQTFLRILRTVKFSGARSSSSRGGSGTGTGVNGSAASSIDADGKPCGGLAGVLCPAGSYCEITDQVNGIGRCRKLR